jgi:hypothetical protein
MTGNVAPIFRRVPGKSHGAIFTLCIYGVRSCKCGLHAGLKSGLTRATPRIAIILVLG